jgi:porphobilinogen deaminase
MRRIVQLKAIRPDLEILDLRGNVNFSSSSVQVGLYNNFLFRSRDQQNEVSE